MVTNLVLEFKSNKVDFVRNTRQRVVAEVVILLLLAGYFVLGTPSWLPNWLELAVLAIFATYILFGVLNYPKAKAAAQNFSILLSDNTLIFPDEGQAREIPYSDLVITEVNRKNLGVVKIGIKTKFGQSIQLKGLENMNELYAALSKNVKEI